MERHSFRIVSDDLPKQCGNCAYPQNLHAKKLEKIAVFFVVRIASSANSLDETNSLQMLFVLFKDGFCQSFFIF